MAWTVEYQSSLHYVEYIYQGRITGQDLEASTTKGIVLGKTYDTNCYLVDLTAMELSASFLDVYNLPAQQYLAQGLARDSRIAVIMPKSDEATKYVKFYEDASTNRGWMVRVFPDRATALAWLLSPVDTQPLNSEEP